MKKPNLEFRVNALETLMEQHLKESLGIQNKLQEHTTSLDWIKKGVWTSVGATLTTFGALSVALIVYLLHR